MKKWLPKSIKLDAKGLAKFLGERESEVMEIAWDQGCVTVRDVCDTLCQKREYSFNTIMTIMNRLADKGLLAKSQDGATYCYRATQKKDALLQSAVDAVVASLSEDDALEMHSNKRIVKEAVLNRGK